MPPAGGPPWTPVEESRSGRNGRQADEIADALGLGGGERYAREADQHGDVARTQDLLDNRYREAIAQPCQLTAWGHGHVLVEIAVSQVGPGRATRSHQGLARHRHASVGS